MLIPLERMRVGISSVIGGEPDADAGADCEEGHEREKTYGDNPSGSLARHGRDERVVDF